MAQGRRSLHPEGKLSPDLGDHSAGALTGAVPPMLGGPEDVYKTDVAAKTTTENEIHKEKREIPVTLQN